MSKTKKVKGAQPLIGIDYGSSQIGLALGVDGFVSPLEIIPSKELEAAINKITRVAIENKVQKFVVGIPLDAAGKETKQSLEVRRFGNLLKVLSKKRVIYWDEFGTSKEALNQAVDLGVDKKQRRSNDDLAAALILRSYYESN